MPQTTNGGVSFKIRGRKFGDVYPFPFSLLPRQPPFNRNSSSRFPDSLPANLPRLTERHSPTRRSMRSASPVRAFRISRGYTATFELPDSESASWIPCPAMQSFPSIRPGLVLPMPRFPPAAFPRRLNPGLRRRGKAGSLFASARVLIGCRSSVLFCRLQPSTPGVTETLGENGGPRTMFQKDHVSGD